MNKLYKREVYQRLFDIVISGTTLLLLSPILIIVAIILKLTGNDIFYRQKRIGRRGKIFNVFKFTTMLKDSETMGTGTITLKNDIRVLPIGKFLRKSKLNELPQLLNILLGDMSLIGPRPQDEEGFNAFNKEEQEIIVKARPGLSGVGSIIFRNEDEVMEKSNYSDKKKFYNEVISPYKGEIEAWYVKNKSLVLYFTLIFLTLYVVIFSKRKVNFFDYQKDFPMASKGLKEFL